MQEKDMAAPQNLQLITWTYLLHVRREGDVTASTARPVRHSSGYTLAV